MLIHLHGHGFTVTGTDGGPRPKAGRWPEVTTDVAEGQMRQIEFAADEAGDWALRCHKSHHTVNAMGHNVPTMIGLDHQGIAARITKLIPDDMVMVERGMAHMAHMAEMAEMAEMAMPLPDNTAPMVRGDGPAGSVEMGGMYSLRKVRRRQPPGDCSDPGWFVHPPGTVALEWAGALPAPARLHAEGQPAMPAKNMPCKAVEVQVRKPAGHSGH